MAINPSLLFAGSGNASVAFFAPELTAAPVGTVGTAGVQSVSLTGTPAGGTFTLSYNGNVTSPIAYSATAAQVQSALQVLPGLGSLVTASGGPLPAAVIVTIPAGYAQYTLVANGAALTGGTSPAAVVAVTTAGVASTNAATAPFAAAWLDAGLIVDTGIVQKINESSKAVFAYGITTAVKTLVSQRVQEIDLSFMEFNAVTLAVSNRKPLSSVSFDNTGFTQVLTGGAALPRYAAAFDVTDGANKVRLYCPSVSATSVTLPTFAPATEAVNAVALTCYPDATGTAVYTNYSLRGLAL